MIIKVLWFTQFHKVCPTLQPRRELIFIQFHWLTNLRRLYLTKIHDSLLWLLYTEYFPEQLQFLFLPCRKWLFTQILLRGRELCCSKCRICVRLLWFETNRSPLIIIHSYKVNYYFDCKYYKYLFITLKISSKIICLKRRTSWYWESLWRKIILSQSSSLPRFYLANNTTSSV